MLVLSVFTFTSLPREHGWLSLSLLQLEGLFDRWCALSNILGSLPYNKNRLEMTVVVNW